MAEAQNYFVSVIYPTILSTNTLLYKIDINIFIYFILFLRILEKLTCLILAQPQTAEGSEHSYDQ
jgi:hypothetical protein